MDKILEILSKIDLTKQESRVYLALLELQESQTGKLCEHTKIARSNIYIVLDSLIEKGLVSYKLKNNIKVFMPSSPDVLNELFLEKQEKLNQERKEINDLISNLKKTKLKKDSISDYKYYEGITGIKALWHEINSEMNKDSNVYYYTAKKESYERLVGFYTEHQKIVKKLGINACMILPIEDKKLAVDRKKSNPKLEIKFKKLENNAEWGVVGDLLYIQYIKSKKPLGFLIKDEIIANTFKEVFMNVWVKD